MTEERVPQRLWPLPANEGVGLAIYLAFALGVIVGRL